MVILSWKATEIARSFGKRFIDWRRLPKTISLFASAKKADMGKSLNGDNLIFTEVGDILVLE